MANPLPIQPSRHDVYDFISPTKGTKDAALGKAVLITGAGSGIGEVSTGNRSFRPGVFFCRKPVYFPILGVRVGLKRAN
jgi:hypothetical protein